MIEIDVTCDHGDCPESIVIAGHDALSRAYRKLHGVGWKVNHFAQVCPKHVEAWTGVKA
jgi:hypothetical protein